LRAESESPTDQRSERQPADAHSLQSGFAGGTEWVVDAWRCRAELLRDLEGILSICQAVIDNLGLTVVGRPQSHQFPGPGGVTAMFLLSESHLACHTYPEHRFATFNVYCCRRRACWDWQRELAERLGAERVMVREIDRSIDASTMAEGECRR
jgi:S-adenosylmethionine decarboxylase